MDKKFVPPRDPSLKPYQRPTLLKYKIDLGVFGNYSNQSADPGPRHGGKIRPIEL